MKALHSILILLLIIMVSACQSQTRIDTFPRAFRIDESRILFEPVNRAERYRIEATHLETETTRRFLVNVGDDINQLHLQAGTYALRIQGLSALEHDFEGPYSDFIHYIQIDPFAISTLEEAFLLDHLHIRWLGRHRYDTDAHHVRFDYTSSGFMITFEGYTLDATFWATQTFDSAKRPHLVVLEGVDQNPADGQLIVLNQPIQTVRLFERDHPGPHTIRVLKRSESIDSKTALIRLETDGAFKPTEPLSPRKIEIVAASSSAGFGNLAAQTNEAKTTTNSDGLRAFAYLAARRLDAEINIVSASGWPLLKGPWTGDNNMVSAYEQVDVSTEILWDHQQYVPDVIVINLGTNDFSYIRSLDPHLSAAAEEAFIEAYVSFMRRLYAVHPYAQLVVVYGLMAESHVYEPTLEAISRIKDEDPLFPITSLQLPAVNIQEGIGSSNHPSLRTHIRAADVLAEMLSTLLDWPLIRPNIQP